MNDAVGATVSSEMVRTVISLLAVALLGVLFWGDWLNIHSLFAQQYLMLGATALGYWLVTRRHWREREESLRFHLSKAQNRAYCREFFDYSHPLFVQALLSFLLLTAERWLLQWFDGSAEQGFFALSQKVSMACFLFVSAMTPLIMRELSIAWGQKDRVAMARLLTRFAPPALRGGGLFSCFTLAEGPALVNIFGGAEFTAAILPVQIMALYPLHQAYGQLAGSVFHATGRTRVLRNIAALECVYGFATAWFLLAPPGLLGLNLGAVGLALKNRVRAMPDREFVSLAGLALHSPELLAQFRPSDLEPCRSAAAGLCLPRADHRSGLRRSGLLPPLLHFRRALQPALPGPLPGRAPGAGPFPPGIARAVHPPEKIPPGCVGQTSIMLCSCHRYMP